MITIGQYTTDGQADYGPLEFERKFLEICRAHRFTERALVFAMLLYDFRHPQIIKVLRDVDYWNSLDSLSGSSLSVFAFHSPAAPTRAGAEARLPEFGKPVREILAKHFDLSQRPAMPSILFFQVGGDSVICHYLVQVRAETTEGAFREIDGILSAAVHAIENVSRANYGNAQEIFDLVAQRLRQQRTVEAVCRGIGHLTSLEKIVKLMVGLLPRSA